MANPIPFAPDGCCGAGAAAGRGGACCTGAVLLVGHCMTLGA